MKKSKEILKQYFGYDEFREGQETLIDSILSGRDTLGIMPTGAGKSLCFQIPALMMDGITLVISPLISLMKDQVEALNQAGIHAAYLNSSLTSGQYFKALGFAREGRYPIIYVAPERLVTEAFLDFATHTKISMIAVDEAHCVSQWGQDFRPSYLKILEFVEKLSYRPVISAFTASATREVRDDIIDILKLQEPTVMTTGFDRPNLYFEVQTPKNKYDALKEYLGKHEGESGIIYCLTRKNVEEVCANLIRDGIRATRYHAGLTDAERKNNQDNEELDDFTCQIVRQRDQERLRQMTFYCFTNECLRDYILRYFGEYGDNYCGNCSNCQTQFEEVNVTEVSRCLVGCVKESGQLYGVNVLLDTVHGANTAKIRQYRMNENSYHGALNKMPAYRLRQVMNHLLLKGYLQLTEDEYMIVKLTERSEELLDGNAEILMKMAKEQEKRSAASNAKKSRKKSSSAGILGEMDEPLFEKLRALRTEIARAEKVPPYIIFSDKTLIHMCILRPETKVQMLGVSGVGEYKYEKYGEQFLQVIGRWKQENIK